jgi:hypothetical protein
MSEAFASVNALLNNKYPVSMSWRGRLFARWTDRFPLAYEFARELRSFLYHTGTLLWRGAIPLADIGPLAGAAANGNPVGCSRLHGRMLDTQRFADSYRYASSGDLRLFLAGWNAGARSCDLFPHECRPQNGEDVAACMSPRLDFASYTLRKPKRNLAAQQPTKCKSNTELDRHQKVRLS